MSEIGNGFAWYKFDIDGWLSSPDVQQMKMHERGMYHHLLTIQGRDGKLSVGVVQLAKQAGQDRRSVQYWMKKWGYLFPIVQIEPDVDVTPALRPCSAHDTSAQPSCSACAPPPMPLRCFPAASWMRTGDFRVNPKQWNLSVLSGKFRGQPILEERREGLDLDRDEREDKTDSLLTLKPRLLVAKGEGA